MSIDTHLSINAQRVRDIIVISGASWGLIFGLWTFVGKPKAEEFVLQTVGQTIEKVVKSVDLLSKEITLAKRNQQLIQADIDSIKKLLDGRKVSTKDILDKLDALNDKMDKN